MFSQSNKLQDIPPQIFAHDLRHFRRGKAGRQERVGQRGEIRARFQVDRILRHAVEVRPDGAAIDSANGRNVQSVRSLSEDLEDKLAEEGILPRRKEGMRESKWIVLDYAHVIVHVFHPDERKFYNIERLWQDGTNQVEFIPLNDQDANH